MFKVMKVNDLQNMIIREKLEDVMEIREVDLVHSHGQKYSFFVKGKLVNSFEVDSDYREIDETAIDNYIIGYIDAYTSIIKRG